MDVNIGVNFHIFHCLHICIVGEQRLRIWYAVQVEHSKSQPTNDKMSLRA